MRKLLKNKKGSMAVNLLVVFVAIMVIAVITVSYFYIKTSQKAVPGTEEGQKQITDTAIALKTGDVASIGVYVVDTENNDPTTKVQVQVYCKEENGGWVISGTTSSTSAETTGKTTIGNKLDCYAVNSTYNTLDDISTNPNAKYFSRVIDEENEHIVIQAYRSLGAGRGAITFYTDTLGTGTGGIVNVTAGVNGMGTFQKMRFKNNGTDSSYNLGGFYFDKTENSNVSIIDISGSAVLSGMSHASTQVVKSSLGTKISARQTKWDYVFEIDDNPQVTGNQPLYMQENDYLDTGSVSVTANGNGCQVGADLISSFAFAKGYYKSITDNVLFGYENDAVSPSVIGSDITGDTFDCTA